MESQTAMNINKLLFQLITFGLWIFAICRGFADHLPRIGDHQFEPKNTICRGCRGFFLKKCLARAHTCERTLLKTLGSSAMLGNGSVLGVIS